MKYKKSIINEVQIEVYPDNEVYKVSEFEKRELGLCVQCYF